MTMNVLNPAELKLARHTDLQFKGQLTVDGQVSWAMLGSDK